MIYNNVSFLNENLLQFIAIYSNDSQTHYIILHIQTWHIWVYLHWKQFSHIFHMTAKYYLQLQLSSWHLCPRNLSTLIMFLLCSKVWSTKIIKTHNSSSIVSTIFTHNVHWTPPVFAWPRIFVNVFGLSILNDLKKILIELNLSKTSSKQISKWWVKLNLFIYTPQWRNICTYL